MINLVKIGLVRLTKNIYYILGCILAVVITAAFITNSPFAQLSSSTNEGTAILISAAIILFFTVFVGLFIGNENEDGIIRNKVMAGYTQTTIYMSHYITFLIAMFIMHLCWLLGAGLGGAQLGGKLFAYMCISFLANAAYIAVVQALVFRLNKQVVGIVLAVGLFFVMTNFVLFGNLFYTVTLEKPLANTIVAVIYNFSALGQCFARTSFADPGLGKNIIQISDSLAIIFLATSIGTLGLKRRDIK